MAVFSGAMLDKKLLAFMVPLGAMFLSDLFLGIHSSMFIIYFVIMLNVAMGFLLVSKFTYLKVPCDPFLRRFHFLYYY